MTDSNDRHEHIDSALKETLNGEVPAEFNARVRGRLAEFRGRFQHSKQKTYSSPTRLWSLERLAWAGSFAAAVIVVAFLWNAGHATPTWAEVSQTMRTVPFFNATIYYRNSGLEEPRQFEVWMGQSGKFRVRTLDRIYFANRGKDLRVFDLEGREVSAPPKTAVEILEKTGALDELSLESLIRMIPGFDKMSDPIVNPDADLSEELAVFDVTSNISEEWARFWILPKSRLPIRLHLWDPRDADSIDILFSYSQHQPEEFFDPQAFADMAQRDSVFGLRKVNRAYAMMKDPGGKPITPQDMFEESGYCMPELDRIGMTEDGIVWVVAKNYENRSPEGNRFYGFQELTDNLGREYFQTGEIADNRTNRWYGLFIPHDYGKQTSTPSKLTLTCREETDNPKHESVLIGSLEIEKWETADPPKAAELDIQSGILLMAHNLFHNKKKYDRMEELLSMIPGDPDENPNALRRDEIRLSALVRQGKYTEAAELGQFLIPALRNSLLETAQDDRAGHAACFAWTDAILALAMEGQLGEVRRLARELKDIASPTDKGYNWLSTLAKQLSDRAHLEIEEINDLLDVDIQNDERFRQWGSLSNWYSPYHPRPNWPGYEAWENHLKELAEIVKNRPLTDRITLVPHSAPAEVRPLSVAPLPGREDYIVYRLPATLGEIFAVPNWDDKTPVYMPEKLAARAFDHDLITSERIPRGGNSWRFLIDLLLSEDLEMVETTREMEVWTAKYDGRDLKPYEEVKAPLPQDEDPKARTPGSPETMGKLSANYLFYSFNIDQNQDLQADGPWIVNETGIPPDQVISWEGPHLHGAQGPEMAKNWFEEQFGITFDIEKREMKVHLVRERAIHGDL